MPRTRLTADHAETILVAAGFRPVKARGSHRLYVRNDMRITVPFHGHRILHPKVTNHILAVTGTSGEANSAKTRP